MAKKIYILDFDKVKSRNSELTVRLYKNSAMTLKSGLVIRDLIWIFPSKKSGYVFRILTEWIKNSDSKILLLRFHQINVFLTISEYIYLYI